MMPSLSRWMMLRLMRSRAEKHSGCPIDVERLAGDPEYASAIRALARFTLDEELQAICALAKRANGGAVKHPLADIGTEAEADTPRPAHLAQVLQFPMRAMH